MRLLRPGMSVAGALVLAACAATTPSPSVGPSSTASDSTAPSEAASPQSTVAGAYPALVIDLGFDAAPIDVLTGFGSVWVANHHDDTVVRIDPETGLQQARIHLNFSGPGWFTLTEDEVWVTRQNDAGMAQIDPATDEVVAERVGFDPPCGWPASGLGAVWYFACDSGEMVRIDLASGDVKQIEAPGLSPPIIVDEVLYASGPEGMVRLADDGTTWTPIGGCCGMLMAYAGGTFWLLDGDEILRTDLVTGVEVGRIPMEQVGVLSPGADVMWIAPAEGTSGPLRQIRMSDNSIGDDLQVSRAPVVARVDGSTMWVTDFGDSELWRVDLGE